MKVYIYQQNDWPNFKWNSDEFVVLLSEARNLQGRLFGKMESLGFDLRNEALLDTLTLDVLKSSEIEGKLTSSKWAKIAKCSKDTAIRDINDLISKDILKKEEAGGRSTSYELK
jgi:Fic family protein